jgi:hypothetical protein
MKVCREAAGRKRRKPETEEEIAKINRRKPLRKDKTKKRKEKKETYNSISFLLCNSA